MQDINMVSLIDNNSKSPTNEPIDHKGSPSP